MRLLGAVAAVALLACLATMAVGLLGGPGASIIPWIAGGASERGHGPGGTTGPAAEPPAPTAVPSPTPLPATGPPPSPSASASPSRSASRSPSPVTTNRAGRTPPGRNRTPRPKHSHAG
jgi:hypothetical protein